MTNPCLHSFVPEFVARDYLSGEDFAVHRCEDCDLLATQVERAPVNEQAFYPDEYYGEEQRYSGFLAAFLNGLTRFRLRVLSGHLDGTGRVLDVGCGQGGLLDYLRARGFTTTGIEVSDAAAFHARKVLGLDILVGEESIAEVPTASQDLVVLWHVLEHVSDPAALLQHIRRVMSREGVLLLGVPNAGSIEAKACRAGWFHLDVPRHLLHFDRQNLEQLLKANGLKIERQSYFVPEYDFFSFIQSLQNKLGLPQNRLYLLIRRPSLGSIKKESGEDFHRSSWVQDGLVLISFPVLLLLSFLWVPIAALAQQGSSMTFLVRQDVE